ncbi:LOW QUALITY PROTEIN: serine/threonine-protein kinase 33 [Scomber scombrus]|uniref:LOW QUALITY PROTEIN: serine/threonine-protein kinase 33 n=1 Tax=Scomber scombrus TaxID=13677 RepID=A0AAV1N5M0_SCOSC
MTQADVSGLDMNMVSQRTGRDTVEKEAPHIRLEDDADLKEIYTFGRKLGQGSFGVVYQATHIETNTQWAIKEVCRPEAGSSKVKLLEQELKILRQVNHANIIHLEESYETAKMTYLVTELCDGGELKELLLKKMFFTEDETRHIIRSLADAIVYLHKRDIVHRDLKLENILVKNNLDKDGNDKINIKVTDFGLSVMTGGVGMENMMTDACGTLIYMAPEMMSGRCYSQWCDEWSIGIIMYILLSGEPPFMSKTKSTLLEKIMKKELKFTQPIWSAVSDAAKNVLTCLLKVDPAYRMSANQLLENPWITGDTNMPAIPSNVLEMMRHHKEQEEITRALEDFTSSEDTLDLSLLHSTASTETDSSCRSQAKLSPERDCSLCTPSSSTKPILPGVKPTRQSSAKQRRPQDKRDVGTVQRAAPDLSKADDQRPSTSIKSKTGFRKPPASSKTTVPSEQDKNQVRSREKV